jgi:hypothetical protein
MIQTGNPVISAIISKSQQRNLKSKTLKTPEEIFLEGEPDQKKFYERQRTNPKIKILKTL